VLGHGHLVVNHLVDGVKVGSSACVYDIRAGSLTDEGDVAEVHLHEHLAHRILPARHAVNAVIHQATRHAGDTIDGPKGRIHRAVAHGGIPLQEVDLAPPVVLVLGAEREGLPDDVLARCDVRASIPQAGGAESLNVATAGAIALYELARRS